MLEIELISFDLCPFVQRSVITLHEKEVPFTRINIDLANKPDWFLQLSPLGKVPVMRIGGEGGEVLFESAVINEYLDEVTPPSLHPEAPLEKAKNRAWIEFGAALLGMSYHHMASDEKAKSLLMQEEMEVKLGFLEDYLVSSNWQGPFFNGSRFSLVDAAYAPLFIRLCMLNSKACEEDLLAKVPCVDNWSKGLLERQSVQKTIPENFEELATERFAQNGGWLAQKHSQRLSASG